MSKDKDLEFMRNEYQYFLSHLKELRAVQSNGEKVWTMQRSKTCKDAGLDFSFVETFYCHLDKAGVRRTNVDRKHKTVHDTFYFLRANGDYVRTTMSGDKDSIFYAFEIYNPTKNTLEKRGVMQHGKRANLYYEDAYLVGELKVAMKTCDACKKAELVDSLPEVEYENMR